jgi:hypothetical protein
MVPDILGFRVEEGINILLKSGIKSDSIVIKDYLSPKEDILGNDRRILRVDEENERITLIVSNF